MSSLVAKSYLYEVRLSREALDRFILRMSIGNKENLIARLDYDTMGEYLKAVIKAVIKHWVTSLEHIKIEVTTSRDPITFDVVEASIFFTFDLEATAKWIKKRRYDILRTKDYNAIEDLNISTVHTKTVNHINQRLNLLFGL